MNWYTNTITKTHTDSIQSREPDTGSQERIN